MQSCGHVARDYDQNSNFTFARKILPHLERSENLNLMQQLINFTLFKDTSIRSNNIYLIFIYFIL